jgi:hypothetical protein
MSNPIRLSKALRSIASEAELVIELSTAIRELFPNLSKVKGKVELIKEICISVEERIQNRRIAVDKESLIKTIYRNVFSDSDEKDMEFLTEIVTYLYSSGAIYTRSRGRRICDFFLSYFRESL